MTIDEQMKAAGLRKCCKDQSHGWITRNGTDHTITTDPAAWLQGIAERSDLAVGLRSDLRQGGERIEGLHNVVAADAADYAKNLAELRAGIAVLDAELAAIDTALGLDGDGQTRYAGQRLDRIRELRAPKAPTPPALPLAGLRVGEWENDPSVGSASVGRCFTSPHSDLAAAVDRNGWRVWAPLATVSDHIAEGPETGDAGKAAADAALLRLGAILEPEAPATPEPVAPEPPPAPLLHLALHDIVAALREQATLTGALVEAQRAHTAYIREANEAARVRSEREYVRCKERDDRFVLIRELEYRAATGRKVGEEP